MYNKIGVIFMKYPDFLIENDVIGICAPSGGIGKKLLEYEESLDVLKANGYRIKETKSVRSSKSRSTTARNRAKELDELVCDDEVKMIMEVTGGDYQLETMPYINFKHLKDHPKWLMGYSDPTNLLFTVTTALDIATMYGFNGASYTFKNELEQQNNLNYLKGNLVNQKSFKKWQSFIDIINDREIYQDVYWKTKIPVKAKGRCIGGCLDVIAKLIGTEYDHVNDFIDRYSEDGIIWYFDNFAYSAYETYLTLLQFKYAGYFRNTKAVLIGRVTFPRVDDKELDYEKAYKLALKDIPYITEMDIGHTHPRMTMINGAIINVEAKDGKGKISFELK